MDHNLWYWNCIFDPTYRFYPLPLILSRKSKMVNFLAQFYCSAIFYPKWQKFWLHEFGFMLASKDIYLVIVYHTFYLQLSNDSHSRWFLKCWKMETLTSSLDRAHWDRKNEGSLSSIGQTVLELFLTRKITPFFDKLTLDFVLEN